MKNITDILEWHDKYKSRRTPSPEGNPASEEILISTYKTNKQLTVGDLKKALSKVDDNLKIYIPTDSEGSSTCDTVKLIKANHEYKGLGKLDADQIYIGDYYD